MHIKFRTRGLKQVIIIFLVTACLFACSEGNYESAGTVAKLSVSFTDSKWDGKKVPKEGQCTNCGGDGLSPPLLVKNVPENTDALIVEYIDKTMGVDHGALRFLISGKSEIMIPSVPEQTYDLPRNVEMESEHNAPIGKAGVYMAPCGCGYNNRYVATILAVKKKASGQKLLLGKGKIKLGRF